MSGPARAAIEVEGVVRTFSVRRRQGRLRRERVEVRAVNGVSFTVAPGEMVGYIGPNGSGKSTTIKMLIGILVPTAGRVRVAGLDPSPNRRELAQRLGVVFGQRTQLWWDLPVCQSLELMRHVYRVPVDRHRENLDRFIELLELGPFLDTPVRQLSLGQRMRADLTAAFLHDPEIVVLDEPTIGLDMVSRARVRQFLADVNTERGTTVILTTHDLRDVERVCSRLLVVDRGRLIHDGSVAGVRARFGTERTLVVDLAEELPPLVVDGASVVKVEGTRQWLRFQRTDTTAAALVAAVADQVELVDVSVEEPDIEEIVARLGRLGR